MFQASLARLESGQDSYAGKSLEERNSGRFYTPSVLVADLAERVACLLERSAGSLGPAIYVCDPFCGDGRLVAELLRCAARRPSLRRKSWVVSLKDIDGDAVEAARQAVMASALSSGLSVEVRLSRGDSFAEPAAREYHAVITNPPWELLKPDTREIAHLSPIEAADYRDRLRQRSLALEARFPAARAQFSWGGWSTNLARCGWELALRSCRPRGCLGIVLPAAILADQASRAMRQFAFTNFRLVDLATYSAEARLFERVDQGVITATFEAEICEGIDAGIKVSRIDNSEVRLRLKLDARELEARNYCLPVGFGVEGLGLLNSLSSLPQISCLEASGDLWLGRELDETRLWQKTEPGRAHPFVKGRMVRRHGLSETPSLSVVGHFCSRLKSIGFERSVWRDVSRPSQRRRMIGTIIPRGWVTGNSLHVAHFRDGDPAKLRALHALLSSFVVEFQVRSRLATGHMSLGVVRDAHIPPMTKSVISRLSNAADRALRGDSGASIDLEVAVARAFGLGRDSLAAIVALFPGVSAADRETLLDRNLWRKYPKE